MTETAHPLSLDEIAGRIGGQVHGSFVIGAQVLGQGVNVRWSPQGHLNVYAEGAARYHSGDLRTATLIALGLPVAENDNDPDAPRDLPVLPRMHPAPWTPESAGGLLGEVATWVTSTAIIPVPELSLAASLALLAGLCGDRVLAPTEAGVNVFMTTLLATAGGKGHPPRAARELGDATGKLGAVSNGDPTSYAALERILRRRPSTVIVLDEFGLVLQDINARHRSAPAASIRKFLLAIYDQANSRFDGRAYASAETKGDDSPIEGPALTVLGMTTPGTLYEGLSEASISDGFINRFVFFSASPPAIVKPPSLGRRARPPQLLVDLLRDAIDSLPRMDGLAGAFNKFVIPFEGGEGGEAYGRWGEVFSWQHDLRWDETERHINGRAAENTLRLATLRAISRNPAAPAVSVDDIEWGFAIVHRSIGIISDGIKRHMVASPAEALRNAVKEALRDKPNGLAYSLLLQRQGIRKADNRLLKDALRWLLDAQEIDDASDNREPGKGSRFRLRE